MKILILSDDFPPDFGGGAGMMAYRIAREYVRLQHAVTVVTAVQTKAAEGILAYEGMTVHRIYSSYHERWRSYRSLYNRYPLRKLRRILKDVQPDAVHAHNVHAHLSYASLALAKRSGATVIMTAHDIMSFYPGTFTEFINPNEKFIPQSFDYRVTPRMLLKKFRLRYNPFANFIIRRWLQKIDGVIAVSEALREALTQNNIPVRHVIKNGIDLESRNVSYEIAKAFAHDVGIVGKQAILFQGRLSGAKGGDLVLQAMARVVVSCPMAVLLVIGRVDAYAKRMLSRADKLGIGQNVIFAGWLDEERMKRAYAASAIVTIPSACFDSFPNGNLEAFAVGKPVVSTCFGGSSEIVAHGVNGYIVNPFDLDSFAAALIELLLDTNRAARMGNAGETLVREQYRIESTAQSYLSLFTHDLRV